MRRTTFYTHYADLSELLVDVLASEINGPLEAEFTTGMSPAEVGETFLDALESSLRAVARDRHLFRMGMQSTAATRLRVALMDTFANRLDRTLNACRASEDSADPTQSVRTAFAASGLVASLQAWAHSNDTDSERWAAIIRDQLPPWWPGNQDETQSIPGNETESHSAKLEHIMHQIDEE